MADFWRPGPPHFATRESQNFKLGIHNDGHFTIRSHQAGYPETLRNEKRRVNSPHHSTSTLFFPNKNISSLRHQLQLQGKVPHLRPLRRKTPCWVKEQCLTLRSMSFSEGLEDDSARSPLGVSSVWSRSLEDTLPRWLFDKRFGGKYFQILS